MAPTLAGVRKAEELLAETAIRYAALVDTIEWSRDLLWSRRGGARAHDILGASDAVQRQPDPHCPICLETITDGEVVIFDHGDLIHVDCRHDRPLPRLPLRSAPRRTVSRN